MSLSTGRSLNGYGIAGGSAASWLRTRGAVSPAAISGVTDTDAVVGMSAAFCGPCEGLGIAPGRGADPYFAHIDHRGGVHGRGGVRAPMSAAGPYASPTLVLGGARSGKSTFAEALAEGHDRRVYVATAERTDNEMTRRIEAHRARRGAEWRTVEAPLRLAEAVRREGAPGTCLLVDCLTVWLGNLMHHGHSVEAARESLLGALAATPGPVVAGRERGGSRHRTGQCDGPRLP